MPHIERIEVEDGFLNGLDLELRPGLNVVIGARGTGKTSLLELIRFALGAPAFTERAATMGEAQVRAVLGRGRVILTVRTDDGASQIISRSVGEEPGETLHATVLAQNEIEAVGASASGRLHLVDRFLSRDLAGSLVQARTSVAAAGQVVDAAVEELATLVERTSELPALEEELAALTVLQDEAFERASASADDRSQLESLQLDLQTASLRNHVLDQTSDLITRLRGAIAAIEQLPAMSPWPAEAGQDPLASIREAYEAARSQTVSAGEVASEAARQLSEVADREGDTRSLMESNARSVRRRLGELDQAVATVSTEIAQLNERIGGLRAISERAEAKALEAQRGRSERDRLMSNLADLYEEQFGNRAEIVEQLNVDLHPAVRLEIVQSGDLTDYENEIVSRLRGTGIHTSTLAPALTEAFSPADLLDLIENEDVDTAASATSLSTPRLQSAFAAFRSVGASSLAATRIDDAVELFLLDGAEMKRSGTLSIGQRCTAVLPILLKSQGDILVVDQPEDHLDNAFVTSTLVESLNSRPDGDQIILASHNANIPVLGNADLVVHMDSDGRRGFVSRSGRLHDPDIVRAITQVMEGGAEAFKKRADFYDRHQS